MLGRSKGAKRGGSASSWVEQADMKKNLGNGLLLSEGVRLEVIIMIVSKLVYFTVLIYTTHNLLIDGLKL